LGTALEQKLQRELNQARIFCRRISRERTRKGGSSRSVGEIGVVQNIEDLRRKSERA